MVVGHLAIRRNNRREPHVRAEPAQVAVSPSMGRNGPFPARRPKVVQRTNKASLARSGARNPGWFKRMMSVCTPEELEAILGS